MVVTRFILVITGQVKMVKYVKNGQPLPSIKIPLGSFFRCQKDLGIAIYVINIYKVNFFLGKLWLESEILGRIYFQGKEKITNNYSRLKNI